MTREDILRGIIEGMARRDAKLFVDEWHEAIDPSATDWDSTAWGECLRELKTHGDWTPDELGQDWPFTHYQSWLVKETERLVSGEDEDDEDDPDLVTVDIMRYDDASNLGEAEMPRDQWELYTAESHPAYQWPQGIARAGDVLSRDQLDAIDLDPDTTIDLK